MDHKRLRIHEGIPAEELTIIERNRMVEVTQDDSGDIRVDGEIAIKVRGFGEFHSAAVYIYPKFEWVMGVDSSGLLCLVPLKRVE